jgi:hypothetical protein
MPKTNFTQNKNFIAFKLASIFNPNYAVEFVGKQNFTIISSAHILFWIQSIALF